MLRITTIGSGSSGNCYIVECETEYGIKEKLILEAGISFPNVLKALNFDLSKVVGCLCTHDHGDHAAHVQAVAKHHIPVMATKGTLDALCLSGKMYKPLVMRCPVAVGRFKVMPFKTEHDAAEPCGFLIDCPDGNRIVFATDTYYLKYKFPNVTIFMMECNYDSAILQDNVREKIVHPTVAKRVMKSHMSLAQCIKTLKANDLSKVSAIILIHLSGDNSNSDAFQREIAKVTGKMVYVAKKGLNVMVF